MVMQWFRDRLSERECWVRLFNSDIVNILLKTNGGDGEAKAVGLIL